VGNLLAITGRVNCAFYCGRAAKSINVILKFYVDLTMRKSDFSWLTV